MITAVVLDVDDTLYLERDYVRSGFRSVDVWVSTMTGVSGVGETAWSLFLDGVRRTTLTDALKAHGLIVDDALRDSVVAAYREHEPDISLLEDARALLSLMSSLDVPVGVITDGPRDSQAAKCAALGLDAVADYILLTDQFGRSKPDPWCFQHLEERLGRSQTELIYIADNPLKDFQGPAERGWRAMRVRRELSLHERLETPAGVSADTNLKRLVQACRDGGMMGFTRAVDEAVVPQS